jgi:DNA-binding CsgD family transcriptional regulator
MFSDVSVAFLDDEWRIQHVTSDIVSVLGFSPDQWQGKALLGEIHPADVAAVVAAAARASAGSFGVEVYCRMRASDGSWRLVRLGLLPIAAEGQPPRLALTLSRVDGDRAAGTPQSFRSLEDLLWRLAAELQAVGLISSLQATSMARSGSPLSDLSARQWEIVTRLRRGERVPGIARAMYLSPSTVRSHLTVVFRRFGVRTQEELLEKLREEFGESV